MGLKPRPFRTTLQQFNTAHEITTIMSDMSQKALKYRFYPMPEQDTLLRRTMGCTRLVYNSAFSVRTEAWYKDKQRVGYNDTSAKLALWKKNPELDFLNEVSCVPLQQGLRHLQKAFSNFFDGRAKYPNLKKKRNGGSVQFTKIIGSKAPS